MRFLWACLIVIFLPLCAPILMIVFGAFEGGYRTFKTGYLENVIIWLLTILAWFTVGYAIYKWNLIMDKKEKEGN